MIYMHVSNIVIIMWLLDNILSEQTFPCTNFIFFFKFGRFLGTSGQAVQDISKFSSNKDPVDILENILHWGHLAPTAPDTLGTEQTT